MRIVIQRVAQAKVDVDEKTVGSIGKGVLILFGVHKDDKPSQTLWLANKLVNLRIFADAQDKMNLSLLDIQGGSAHRFSIHALWELFRRAAS